MKLDFYQGIRSVLWGRLECYFGVESVRRYSLWNAWLSILGHEETAVSYHEALLVMDYCCAAISLNERLMRVSPYKWSYTL
jgi:hypothetical protein